MQDSPIIVTGFQRSGTTMIAYILNKHFPKFTNESGIIQEIVKDYAGVLKNIDNITYSRYGEYSNEEVVFKLKGKPGSQAICQLYNQLYDSGITRNKFTQDYGKQRTTVIGQKPSSYVDHEVWGDKITNFAGHLKYLKYVFPKAKIIYVIRNGLDSIASNLRLGWGTEEKLWEKWKIEIEDYLKWSSCDDGYLLIKQEDMLQKGATVYNQLVEFLGKKIDMHHFNSFIYKAEKAENAMRKTTYRYDYLKSIPMVCFNLLEKLGYV